MATLGRLSSTRDVTYSCGSCGYELNLNSSNRITTNIDSKYGKAIRKGIVSFFAIDGSKFSESDELGCVPHFLSRRRTKLMCRKCGNLVGIAYDEGAGAKCKKYDIRIYALQPSGANIDVTRLRHNIDTAICACHQF